MSQIDEREKLKEDLVAKGVACHDKARRGDPHAAREALELFKLAHQLDPSDATVAAYYGSSLALVGRDMVDPNQKVQNALKGLKLLDRAAQDDPENITVRMLRAYVNFRVPEHYFSRTSIAVQEFSYLVERYERDPSVFSRGAYWEFLYHLGKAYQTLQEPEQARTVWKKLIAANPSARYLRLLKAEGMDVGPIDEDGGAARERARLLAEGIALHDRGVAGERSAALKALELFEAAVEEYPDDALLRAYHGSCVSLVGRFAAEANAMFSAAVKGAKLIDDAVKSAPEDPAVRLVRARHAMRLPEVFFGRTAVAIVDLEYLRDRRARGDLSLNPSEWLEVLWLLGNAYFRLDIVEDAVAVWNDLLAEDTGGTYKTLVEEKLAPRSEDAGVQEVDPDDRDALLAEGIRLHDLAVRGARHVAAKALELIKAAFERDMDDPVARAYYGSAIALAVKDETDTSAMFSQVIQGMIHLNTAVKRAPDNLVVRKLRGYLCFKLPETMFHLTKTAIEDFEFLRGALKNEDSPERRRILADLAAAYSRLGQDDAAREVRNELEAMGNVAV